METSKSPVQSPAQPPRSPESVAAASALATPRPAAPVTTRPDAAPRQPLTPSRSTVSAAGEVTDARQKQKGEAKTARIPIKIIPIKELKRKPEWIRMQPPQLGSRYYEIKEILREHKLHTVCEEASCPNIGECFGGHGHLHDHGRQVHPPLPLL